MKKLAFAPIACVAALALAPSAPALAANPCPPGAGSTAYCISADNSGSQAIVAATVKKLQSSGISGLLANKGIKIATGKLAFGASHRYVLRFNDLRPGKHNKSVVVYAILYKTKANQSYTIKVKLRPIGLSILKYARQHHKQVHVEIVNHLRPAGATTSAETLRFIRIS